MSNEKESSNRNEDKSNSSEEESEATLWVNSAMCKNISPIDIRKLISMPKKKKTPGKTKKEKKILVNKSKSFSIKDTGDELVINSKIYYSINKAVTYFLSKYDRTHAQSLTDRRANSRIAEEDMRVICKVPNEKIHVYSIDNHKIIYFSSVTARLVTQTTSEEVIVILN